MKKFCYTCRKRKDVSQFYRDKRAKDGLQGYCKLCCKNTMKARYAADPDKFKAGQRRWLKENPEKAAVVRMRAQAKRLGVTVEAIQAVNAACTTKCMICRKPWKPGTRKLDVDHCHNTKRVRGVLCGNCNTGLGKFKDDPALLQAAIDYLNSNNTFE